MSSYCEKRKYTVMCPVNHLTSVKLPASFPTETGKLRLEAVVVKGSKCYLNAAVIGFVNSKLVTIFNINFATFPHNHLPGASRDKDKQ